MGVASWKARFGGALVLAFTLLAGLLLLGSLASPPAQAATGKAGRTGVPTGTLIVRIGGLPRGERGFVTIVGPRQSRRSRSRFRRRISRLGTVRLRGMRAGSYRLEVHRVKLRRGHGTIKRGASAFPVRKRLRVKVKQRRRKRVNVRYGTILNPGVRTLKARVVRVIGGARKPRGLVLRGKQRYRRGMILSARPGGKLRRGLLARVTAVKRKGSRAQVALRPASIYEVAPNMRFRTRLRVRRAAAASRVSCGGGSGVTPFVRVTNVWADGGWTTSNVWPFREIKTGARVDLDFDIGAGVDIAAVVGVSCTVSLPGFVMQGVVAGIPIYGSIRPGLTGSIGAGARMKAEGKVRVNTGARIGGIPPSASPTVSFGSPRFEFSDEIFADLGLGFGISSEVGIGVAGAANLHAAFGNNLEFSVGGGTCSWDLKLGTFSAAGVLGRWTISTPSTPPLYERNLWQASCSPPPLSVPLVRAEMAWATDADVDLYAWDEAGNLAYFGEPMGISGTELVEDVIPSEGETTHDPEVFLENESPGRRYTFGVCLYSGEASDVTLTVPSVPDPRGTPRSFMIPLSGVGDSAVVTTSPEGSGYAPPPGWCRSAS